MKKWMKIAAVVLAAVLLLIGGFWAGRMNLPAPRTAVSRDMDGIAMENAAMEYGAAPAVMTSASGASSPLTEGRKIVRTADMTLRTTAFEESAAHIEALVAQKGGYIESLRQNGESVRRLSLSARIPSDQLDSFLQALEGTGRVTDRSESASDLTARYQDNEARLQTLYGKRERLNALLLKAEDVEDLIEIESAIADTQYQIDTYETSQRSIDHQVEMSAVQILLVEDTPADSAGADIHLGDRIRAAFAASLEWLGAFAQDTLVFLVVIAPVAVPLAAVIAAVILIRKRRKGK